MRPKPKIALSIFVTAALLGVAAVRVPSINGEGSLMADQFATVSKVSTRVADNGINTLAQQLNEWEQDLKAREAVLADREEVAETADTSRPVVVYVTVIGSLLLILILLNFYLDWRRRE